MTPCRLAWAAALVALCASAAKADTASNFYAGKTITVVVGSEAGGGYDAQAHLMARHFGDFLPGHPTVVVQDMPGAGSITAANYLYNSAPKDGTTIGLIQRTLLTANLTNQKGVRFDVRKLNWLGNLASDLPLIVSWNTSSVKTTADLFTRTLLMGGGGPTSDSEVHARLLDQMIGTQIKIISGYTGEAQIKLAMERGEVEGMGGLGWPTLKLRVPYYLTEHKVNILLQGAVQRAPDLPDVPTPFDFVKSDDDRKVMELFYSQQKMARPMVAPPDLPAERLAALRAAFAAMTADKAFHDDAEKSKIESDASSYVEINRIVDVISSTAPSIAAKFAAINNP